jgi:polyhydroxyalkanoate synthesis regulator phasin
VAKKDNAKKKNSSSSKKQPSRGDAVRSAAAQAIEATAGQAGFTRERAQQLADELVQAAGRFRETLEDLRPAGSDELRTLRERIEGLEARVAKLERAPKRAAPRRRATPAKAAAAPAAPPPPADEPPPPAAEPPPPAAEPPPPAAEPSPDAPS